MKKALFAMVLAMVVAAAAQATTVTLVPSAVQVTPSTIFTVDVVITDVVSPAVEVLDLQVSWDQTLVEAYSAYDPDLDEYLPPVSEGTFIRKQGGPVLEFMDWGPGYLSYTVTRLGSKSSTGSGTAATLTFHCLAAGQTDLNFLVQATDLTGDIILSYTGEVEVDQGGGVVPEPMTLALIGMALTALGFVARKRS